SRRRHTSCLSDWSSDVCSSDLPNTDWFAAVIKPMSLQNNGHVALSGGAERLGYYLSLGTLTEDGYYQNSATRYNQYSFRSNIDRSEERHVGREKVYRWEE